jgi:hypothetical protein
MKLAGTRVAIAMTVITGASLCVGGFGVSTATADTAPNLTCGSTQPGPCTQTAHFSNDDEFGSPLPPAPGCPDVVSSDYVHIVGTGNGVEHVTVNKAQDAWLTSTFTGNATFTPYPASSLSFDMQGNVTGIIGPPDTSVAAFTGKLTEWFGGEFNRQNANQHGIININAVADGQALSLHVNFHAQWAVGADPNGPPTRMFEHVSC